MSRVLPLLALLLAVPALAQGVPLEPAPDPERDEAQPPPPPTAIPADVRPGRVVAQATDRIRGPRRLGGPRTGFTVLSAGTVDRINGASDTCYGYDYECEGENPRLSPSFPIVTQFGWQFETRMFQAQSGLTGVTEWVLLVGGAEHGMFLPSLTFLAGLRAPGGLEVGVGPNLSLSGTAYALAVGMNNEIGEVNIPLNVAVVLGQEGPRASVLVGFTVSERRW